MNIPYPICLWVLIAAAVLTAIFAITWLLLTNLSPGAVRKLEESNPELAAKLEHWLDLREELRLSIRLLHLSAGIVALWALISCVAHLHEAHKSIGGGALALLLCLLCYLLFTETLGCNLSKTGSRFLLRLLMPFVGVLAAILAPVVWPLQFFHRLAKKHRDESEEEHERTTTEDEIMSLVEKAENGGIENNDLDSDERRMIKRIFDLDETLVREIMTPRIDLDAVSQQESLEDIRTLIVKSGHTRIPVYEKSIDHILGVIHAKDLLNAELVESGDLQAFLRTAIFIPETKNVAELLTEFRQNATQFAIVIDEYGGTEGIVTLEDILEEIVGEIHDEYDAEEIRLDTPARRLPDGTILVEGRTPIYQLNEIFEFELPEDEDYDTIGGYVATEIGRIPESGEIIETELLQVEVVEADQRRLIKAKITPVTSDEDTPENGKGKIQ